MTADEWLTLGARETKSKKGYAHFDVRTSMREKKGYILDPEKIAHHGFYPFIHYTKKQIKRSSTARNRAKNAKSVIFVMPRILIAVSISIIVSFWESSITSEWLKMEFHSAR